MPRKKPLVAVPQNDWFNLSGRTFAPLYFLVIAENPVRLSSHRAARIKAVMTAAQAAGYTDIFLYMKTKSIPTLENNRWTAEYAIAGIAEQGVFNYDGNTDKIIAC